MGVGSSVKTLRSGCLCLLTLGVPVPSACLCHLQLCRLLQTFWSTVSLAPAMGDFTLAARREQALRDAEFLTKHSERQSLPWIVAILRIGTGRENWASKHLVPDQTQPWKYIGKAGTLWLNLMWFDICSPIAAGAAWKRQGGFISGGECLSKQGLTLLALWDTGVILSRHAY